MKNSRSIVLHRQQNLLQLLQSEREIDVETASEKLNVSPTTIRRDLAMFEKQHLVERFHGGARLIKNTQSDELEEANTLPTLKGSHLAQKDIIARYAVNLIEDGDTIFMNSSSTTLRMLDYLKDKHVIVITNNGNALTYPHDPLVTVILTGGEIHPYRHSLVGDFALNTLSKIYADKTFIGVGGISVASGISTSVLSETAVNSMMMQRCKHGCYVLAIPKKIGREHNFLSGGIENVNTLITCTGGDQNEVSNLRKHNIKVIELQPQNKAED